MMRKIQRKIQTKTLSFLLRFLWLIKHCISNLIPKLAHWKVSFWSNLKNSHYETLMTSNCNNKEYSGSDSSNEFQVTGMINLGFIISSSTWKCGLETHFASCLNKGSMIFRNSVGSITSKISSSSLKNIT